MSYYLRHAPQELGLSLQAGGWVCLDDLVAGLKAQGYDCRRADLEHVVATSDKQRFALDGHRIRANQGHSVAVDLELRPMTPPARLFHGTPLRFLSSILEKGLLKGERHHVHLSVDVETARQVGQRRGSVVILQVDSATMHSQGMAFYCSSNGVWLTDCVPPQFLKEELST